MRFVEKFEPICRMTDNSLRSLGLYDTYEEANDHAVMQASVNLPEECMKAYEIHKVYINVPVWTNETP